MLQGRHGPAGLAVRVWGPLLPSCYASTLVGRDPAWGFEGCRSAWSQGNGGGGSGTAPLVLGPAGHACCVEDTHALGRLTASLPCIVISVPLDGGSRARAGHSVNQSAQLSAPYGRCALAARLLCREGLSLSPLATRPHLPAPLGWLPLSRCLRSDPVGGAQW